MLLAWRQLCYISLSEYRKSDIWDHFGFETRHPKENFGAISNMNKIMMVGGTIVQSINYVLALIPYSNQYIVINWSFCILLQQHKGFHNTTSFHLWKKNKAGKLKPMKCKFSDFKNLKSRYLLLWLVLFVFELLDWPLDLPCECPCDPPPCEWPWPKLGRELPRQQTSECRTKPMLKYENIKYIKHRGG